MGAGVALADALVGVGEHARATEVLLETGGGDALPLVPACWRPASFEVLRAACSAGTAATTRPRRPSGRCHWPARSAPAPPPRAPIARSARSRCTPKIHKRRRPRAGSRRGGRPSGHADRGRSGAPAGRAGARAGGREGARGHRAGAFGRELSRPAARWAAATGLSASWASSAGASPPLEEGRRRGDRAEIALRARARGRPAHRRPQDQLPDRRGALPEPQDGRDPRSPPLPEARRLVARRGRSRRRARRAHRTLGPPPE